MYINSIFGNNFIKEIMKGNFMKREFIKNIESMQILDSRGNPTVQVKVILENGIEGIAMVPSGASTGSFEAVELRDGNMQIYNGLSVNKAVENINKKISKILIGSNVYNQEELDDKMIKLDGTPNKSKIGANAILGTSLAISRAAANSLDIPLYKYIGGINANTIPLPMMNILNGGRHANNSLNIQEFMIVPVGAKNFKETIQMSVEVYKVLKEILKKKDLATSVGDEGGFAPNLKNDEEAIELLIEAIKKAGFKEKRDFQIALDVASTEMREAAQKIGKEGYYFWKTDEYKTKSDMIEYIANLASKYPIMSIEDGLAEEDWQAWKELTKKIGDKVQLVGDDLFVTNIERLERGIKENIANAILIKPNQIGTLTETLNTIKLAKKNGYNTIISHRSGETEDTFISDLAVGVNSGQIKTGAPARTDRVCKYNRLLNIESEI